jgi:hypothetical protein
MGRRKKTLWSTDKSSNIKKTAAVASLLSQFEFLDLLVSLFGLAGFYSSNNNGSEEEDDNDHAANTGSSKKKSRIGLVSSLESLSMLLVKLRAEHHQQQQQQQQHHHASSTISLGDDDDSSPWPFSNSNSNNNNITAIDEIARSPLFDSILLQLEDQLVVVRQQMHGFLNDAIAQDRADTIHIKREIEALATAAAVATVDSDDDNKGGCDEEYHGVVLISWTLLATRLAAAILSELQVEESLMRNLQHSLDSFYSHIGENFSSNSKGDAGGSGKEMMLSVIRHAVDRLRHHQSILSNSLIYQEAATILSKLVSEAEASSAAAAAASSWTRLSYASTSISMTKTPSDSQEPLAATTPTPSSSSMLDPFRLRLLDHSTTTTLTTPLDLLRDFCAPFSSSSSRSCIRDNDNDEMLLGLPAYCATTTFLLLVGAEGSGKTYTCDEMERFVSSSMVEEMDSNIYGTYSRVKST